MPDPPAAPVAEPPWPILWEAILDWYAARGRKLAFRGTRDPYAILVSEAMAQQTQAARAGDAWVRFMGTFPTPEALAAATPAAVLRAWQGLGYNRRALHLWRAAGRIVELHGGQVPSDLEALMALPGVGPYTARAIAAIGFGLPVGAVDTNVRRVIGRIVAGEVGILAPAVVQEIADAIVPHDRPGAWTHAVMDLGATVCLPRRPNCAACPVVTGCRYAALEAAGERRPAPPRPTAGRAAVRFPTTSRWLRGRIVDRLRDIGDGAWTEVLAPIGGHDGDAVRTALEVLEREGLIELDGAGAGASRRARLALR